MYCKNCGKFLLETDKFCSNCGTPTDKIDEDTMFKKTSQETTQDDGASQDIAKPTPPVENIHWNLQDFPEHGVKKTEDINFDWGVTGIFKKPDDTSDEIALSPAQRTPEAPDKPEGPVEPKDLAKDLFPVETEPVLTGKDLEDEIFAEASLVETIPAGEDGKKKTTKVDKFYTFNKKNEEFQKLLDKEYEKIKSGENDSLDEQSFKEGVQAINKQNDELWPEFNPVEHVAEMARAREAFFGPDATYTIPERPNMAQVKEEPVAQELSEPELKADMPGEEVEPETDMPGEEPLPEADLLPDLNPMDSSEEVDVPPAESPEEPTETAHFEATEPTETVSQAIIAEAATTESAGPAEATEPAESAYAEATEQAEASIEATEPAEATESAGAIPAEATEPAEAIPAEPAEDDEVKSIREKWLKYEEENDDDDEEEHKTGKFAKFIIGLLILILLVQVVLLGIKFIAPESAVAQFVDDKVQSVITFFQGKDNTSLDMVADRTVAAEDKTGLIQLQIDKNKDSAITDISYNADLSFVPGKSYQDSKIKDSIELQDNLWYKDKAGTQVYYDEQAVGAVISYESSKKLKDKQEFQTLQIGEIRVSGEDLYVWVAEKITPDELQQKIIKVAVKGESMAVVTEYDA